MEGELKKVLIGCAILLIYGIAMYICAVNFDRRGCKGRFLEYFYMLFPITTFIFAVRYIYISDWFRGSLTFKELWKK